jgi:hypothetical protein
MRSPPRARCPIGLPVEHHFTDLDGAVVPHAAVGTIGPAGVVPAVSAGGLTAPACGLVALVGRSDRAGWRPVVPAGRSDGAARRSDCACWPVDRAAGRFDRDRAAGRFDRACLGVGSSRSVALTAWLDLCRWARAVRVVCTAAGEWVRPLPGVARPRPLGGCDRFQGAGLATATGGMTARGHCGRRSGRRSRALRPLSGMTARGHCGRWAGGDRSRARVDRGGRADDRLRAWSAAAGGRGDRSEAGPDRTG